MLRRKDAVLFVFMVYLVMFVKFGVGVHQAVPAIHQRKKMQTIRKNLENFISWMMNLRPVKAKFMHNY
jgi:hypothetical protein